jgi:hypothetical protein
MITGQERVLARAYSLPLELRPRGPRIVRASLLDVEKLRCGHASSVAGAAAASRGAAPYSPNVNAGCKLWLRASAANITFNTTDVSQWNDTSTIGTNHATQATGANQPLWNSSNSLFGGKPSVDFTRANGDFMIADGLGAMVSGTGKAYDIFVVCSFPTLANTRALWSFGNSASATPFLYGYVSSAKAISAGKTNDAAATITLQDNTNLLTDATPYLLRFSSTGTLLSLYVNGTATLIAGSTEQSGAMTTNRFTIGGLRTNGAPSNLFNGSIAEVIVYDNQIGSTPAATLTTQIRAYYGF